VLTSEAEAAWTVQMGVSLVGLMEVMSWLGEEGMNSLLMKRPVGRVNLRPLGAVRSMERDSEAMVGEDLVKVLFGWG